MNSAIIPKPTHDQFAEWLAANRDHPNLGHHFMATVMPGIVDLQLDHMTGEEAIAYIESMYVQPRQDEAADDTAFALPA